MTLTRDELAAQGSLIVYLEEPASVEIVYGEGADCRRYLSDAEVSVLRKAVLALPRRDETTEAQVEAIIDDMACAWAWPEDENAFRLDCQNLIGAVQRAYDAAREPTHAQSLDFVCPCCGARGTTDGKSSMVSKDGATAFSSSATPQPAQSDAVREALAEIVGCFDAAFVEGLQERLNEIEVWEPGSLPDLINRRLLPAHEAARAALSAPRPAVEGFKPVYLKAARTIVYAGKEAVEAILKLNGEVAAPNDPDRIFNETCTRCGGSGDHPGGPPGNQMCSDCDGRGFIPSTLDSQEENGS